MTETRTYVGQSGTIAFDGFAGFVIGRQYQLQYTREGNEVHVQMPHGSPGAGPLVLTAAQFERWFVKG